MARGGAWWRWCSYKRTTFVVCSVNVIVALCVLRSVYLHVFSSSSDPDAISEFKYTDDQIRRAQESIRLRQESEPAELVKLVKKLNGFLQEERLELSLHMKQNLTNEILSRLKGVNNAANVTEQREAIERWRTEKLKAVRKTSFANPTINTTTTVREAKYLEKALESNLLMLLEDIGLWMPADVVNKDNNNKPENEPELEEEDIIPGRPIPPECHAERHTDYDGAAVRWGLTHHKETAADCCQACLDHAKRAKPGESKCNIWVYCPSPSGCYSPDIYEHKHQECWLKQAATPRLNFKDKYSESYRNSHPTAPVIVPWLSGVVSV
ncbi:Ferritin-like protein [Dioscorea alata]|uniref:Ferritin-like protein n=1 Tax=Dioscorea alata TaxID=55571 RepID=A0ACB7U2W3_DIOAL|nr:Ferritin-like protein [Dioscorea alata]